MNRRHYPRGGGARAHCRWSRLSGQALVEFALILPIMLLLLGVAYTGWDAMRTSVGLTSAARAGAITAASDLQAGKSQAQALADATAAINAEEATTIYGSSSTCGNACVTLTQMTGTRSSVPLVLITVTRSVTSDVPVVSGIRVRAQAGASIRP